MIWNILAWAIAIGISAFLILGFYLIDKKLSQRRMRKKYKAFTDRWCTK